MAQEALEDVVVQLASMSSAIEDLACKQPHERVHETYIEELERCRRALECASATSLIARLDAPELEDREFEQLLRLLDAKYADDTRMRAYIHSKPRVARRDRARGARE